MSQNRPVKIDHFPDFDLKREPNFAILSILAILVVFGRFWSFLGPLWFSAKKWCFYRSRNLRFSLGHCQKPRILDKFHEKPENHGFS